MNFSKNLRALLFNDDYRMNLIALHQKFETYISRNETAGIVSNFYIHVAVTILYYHDRATNAIQLNRRTDHGNT